MKTNSMRPARNERHKHLREIDCLVAKYVEILTLRSVPRMKLILITVDACLCSLKKYQPKDEEIAAGIRYYKDMGLWGKRKYDYELTEDDERYVAKMIRDGENLSDLYLKAIDACWISKLSDMEMTLGDDDKIAKANIIRSDMKSFQGSQVAKSHPEVMKVIVEHFNDERLPKPRPLTSYEQHQKNTGCGCIIIGLILLAALAFWWYYYEKYGVKMW